MTKEELLNKKFSIADFGERKDALYFSDLMSLFESNVVIPKGENRHKNADIIHAYAEGLAGIEVLRSEGWAKFKQSGMCLCIGDEYRIRPSEPVYEWQLYRISNGCPYVIKRDDVFPSYFTDEEIEKVMGAVKFEETKRIRQ